MVFVGFVALVFFFVSMGREKIKERGNIFFFAGKKEDEKKEKEKEGEVEKEEAEEVNGNEKENGI